MKLTNLNTILINLNNKKKDSERGMRERLSEGNKRRKKRAEEKKGWKERYRESEEE
jgi:hypothetical protein